MLRILVYYMFIVILWFPNNLLGQETRTYILSVDFGPEYKHEDFWHHWEETGTRSRISRTIGNVFDQDGVNIQISSSCFETESCGISFEDYPDVYGTPFNNLLGDGIRITDRNVSFRFNGLPTGYYDLRFFFHDSSVSSHSGSISLKVTDSRSPGGKLLSNDINYSTSTNPSAVSTFRLPVEVRNEQFVQIDLSSNVSNYIVNGFELTQYGSVEKLSNGIELIGPKRNTEALISGFRSGSESILACAIRRGGRYYFGSYYENSDQCQAIINESIIYDDEFKFIKFDPYFYWQSLSSPTVPFNALHFTTDSRGNRYYPCAAQESSNRFFPGIYVPDELNYCQADVEGSIRYFSRFYIYSEK